MGRYSPTSKNGSMKLLHRVTVYESVFEGTGLPIMLYPGAPAVCRLTDGSIFLAAVGADTTVSHDSVWLYWWVLSVGGATLATGRFTLIDSPGGGTLGVQACALPNNELWVTDGGARPHVRRLRWTGSTVETLIYVRPTLDFPSFGQSYLSSPNFRCYHAPTKMTFFSGITSGDATGRLVGVTDTGGTVLAAFDVLTGQTIAMATLDAVTLRMVTNQNLGGLPVWWDIDLTGLAGLGPADGTGIAVGFEHPMTIGGDLSTGSVFAADPLDKGIIVQNQDRTLGYDRALASFNPFAFPDASVHGVRGSGFAEVFDNKGHRVEIPHPDTRIDFSIDHAFPDGIGGSSNYSDNDVYYNTSTAFGGGNLYSFAITYNPVTANPNGSQGFHRLDRYDYRNPSAPTYDTLTLDDADPAFGGPGDQLMDDFNYGERAVEATADGIIVCAAHRYRDDQVPILSQLEVWIVQGPPWPVDQPYLRMTQRDDHLGVAPRPPRLGRQTATSQQNATSPRIAARQSYQ